MFHVENFFDYLSPKKPHQVTLSGGIHQSLLMGHMLGLILRVSSHGADIKSLCHFIISKLEKIADNMEHSFHGGGSLWKTKPYAEGCLRGENLRT